MNSFNNENTPIIILNYIKKLTIASIVLWGLYILVFHYAKDLINAGDLFRFIGTRHLFYYLQILLTMLGLLFFHMVIYHEFKIKNLVFYFLFSTILVDARFFHEIHLWIREHNLYFDIFRTGKDGSVVSFQYSRILLLLFSSSLLLGSFIFVKKNFQKLFLMLFTFIFFFFVYNMHLHVGRQAFKDYELELKTNMELILNNDNNYQQLCSGFKLDCYLLDLKDAQNFSLAKPALLNRIIQKFDTKTEANKITQELLNKFLESKQESIVFMEAQFQTDNLRAACYGFKKVNDKILILIDFNNLGFALDLYLIYFSIVVTVFLIFWLSALLWVYNKHKHMPFFNK